MSFYINSERFFERSKMDCFHVEKPAKSVNFDMDYEEICNGDGKPIHYKIPGFFSCDIFEDKFKKNIKRAFFKTSDGVEFPRPPPSLFDDKEFSSWDITSPIKNDSICLKTKNFKIVKGVDVTVDLTITTYFNERELKAGYFFNLHKIE